MSNECFIKTIDRNIKAVFSRNSDTESFRRAEQGTAIAFRFSAVLQSSELRTGRCPLSRCKSLTILTTAVAAPNVAWSRQSSEVCKAPVRLTGDKTCPCFPYVHGNAQCVSTLTHKCTRPKSIAARRSKHTGYISRMDEEPSLMSSSSSSEFVRTCGNHHY